MANNTGKPKPDTLSMDVLASKYALTARIIDSDPELKNLFMQATRSVGSKTEMSRAEFQTALQNTKWYAEHNQYARQMLVAQARGGADWDAMSQTASVAVNTELTRLGLQSAYTDAQKQDLAVQYMANGWGAPGRQQLMTSALTQGATGTSTTSGVYGTVSDDLRRIAANNGMTFNDTYYKQQGDSINLGLSTLADEERSIRQQAATMFPVWKDKILAGQDAIDLASGYINTMAQTFEVDPASIKLNDPYLKQAFGQTDPNGNPAAMGLWDFQKMLRNDPRWMQTKQAQDQMSSVAHSVLQTFGFMG